MTDDLITDHPYEGELRAGASCQYVYEDVDHSAGGPTICARQAMQHAGAYQNDEQFAQTKAELCGQPATDHANPGPTGGRHLIQTHPHDFVPQKQEPGLCDYRIDLGGTQICGYPERLHHWADLDRREAARKAMMKGQLVRSADAAQYERPPMPDAARLGPVVTLIDAPVDPLGTLAVIGGIYTGKVRRSKSEVTDEERRQMLADMQSTVLNGPLEAIQFTFLVEGLARDITHQMVRNRFAFFAQESLRFAVAEDWAQEVPLPPSLSAVRVPEGRENDVAGEWIPKTNSEVAVGIWRKALNQAEDAYNALIGAGMPAEEARKVLPHAITTRLYWTVSLRTLVQEAGKRTCTQAQFDWRQIFGGVAKALRERGRDNNVGGPAGAASYWRVTEGGGGEYSPDGWQYRAFADLLRPVCYQQGKCGFMAKFDRGCTIRERVNLNEKAGRPSSEWHTMALGIPNIEPIDPREWAADPAAARVREGDK